MYEFLDERLKKELSAFKGKNINEIRLRADCPISVLVDGKTVFIDKIKPTIEDIENVMLKVCKRSIHTYEEQIKLGFITSDNGERIGLSGEIVKSEGKISTIKNVTSLCIRIPNDIYGVALDFFNKVYVKNGGSVLVLSEPGVGKTTFIRDLTRLISDVLNKNVIVVDERNEIAVKNGNRKLLHGKNIDVLTYSDKQFGFTQAIRTLNPHVIVTDELIEDSDVSSVIDTIYGGVWVVATAHAKSIDDCFSRLRLVKLKESKAFDYYVVITKNGCERLYEYYDKDFNLLCF